MSKVSPYTPLPIFFGQWLTQQGFPGFELSFKSHVTIICQAKQGLQPCRRQKNFKNCEAIFAFCDVNFRKLRCSFF